jgi:precorrin-2 dehydrogenase/sirohydrochlorin ferrochelatase
VPYTYSILLDLAGDSVVIVGGGPVAARKARGALAAGAAVRVVAPRFSNEMPAEVHRVPERYRPAHLDGAKLVFAATDDKAVNDAVVRDAKARGVWVNRADAEDGDAAGNFIVPAQFDRHGVVVSVSAGSAAMSVAIRDRLIERFDPAWATLAEIVRKLRPMVRESGLAPPRRAAIFRELASFIDDGGKDVKGEEAIREWLRRRLAEVRDETE